MPTPSGQNAHEDENLVIGWTVQGGGQGQAAATGVPSAGYAQAGNTASSVALTTTGNGTPGAPNPLPGNVTEILANPGYADVNPALVQISSALAASLVPVPASGTAFTNPVALSCTVAITGGTLTAVHVGSVLVGTGDGQYTVPGGGTITLTYSVAPTWTWVTV